MISVMRSDGCGCDLLKHEVDRLKQDLERAKMRLETVQGIGVKSDASADDSVRDDQFRYLATRINIVENENKVMRARLEQLELHMDSLNRLICRLTAIRPKIAGSRPLVA